MQHYTCSFSNAILSSRCGCTNSAKNCIAEKEFAACKNEEQSKKCEKLYNFLYSNSHFAVQSIMQNNLTVAQQNKVKIGGIKALGELINHSDEVSDISSLVEDIEHTYQSFEEIPLEQIIHKIAKFKIRDKT